MRDNHSHLIVFLLSFLLSIGSSHYYDYHNRDDSCPRCSDHYGVIDTTESRNPSVFRDLTEYEYQGLLKFLYEESDLNLTRAANAQVRSNYIFAVEVFLPPKKEVLRYLDGRRKQPSREAMVMIYRGGIPEPDVIEIIVGDLPHPTGYRHVPYRPISLPFVDRPASIYESIEPIREIIEERLGDMFEELYGARLLNCNDRCLILTFFNQVAPTLSGVSKRRFFFWLQHDVDFNLLRQLDFAVLVEFDIEVPILLKIWFDGRLFDNLDEVVAYYQVYKEFIKKAPFPQVGDERTVFARGKPQFSKPLKDPSQVSPDGKRYCINDRHVSYGYWEFDIGNVVFQGIRLFDIRYKGERIAYEVSMQEVSNFYFGTKPQEFSANYLDTRFLGGTYSRYLVPGVDCPYDATFLTTTFQIEVQDERIVNPQSICIFEFNTHLPLRRHHGYFSYLHQFYEGVENIVLIVRTIPVVNIYDYVQDFIFYNNGVMEVKITASGVIGTYWYGEKNPFSFELAEGVEAPLHQHLFSIKADIDVKGTRNRFETLDIEQVVTPNPLHINPFKTITQNKFSRRLKETEREAAYHYDFDSPKYLLFVNHRERDRFGNKAGVRIENHGMTKMLRPPYEDNNQAVSWAQYQMAVTKYKDSEPKSSSVYVNSDDPVFTFEQFIADNENIVDEDLVAWLSVGLYHIPHTEDLPITHSPGMSKSVFFSPFNYFKESPGMSTANAVRIDKVEENGEIVTVDIHRYGTRSDVTCVPKRNPFEEILKRDPCQIVECV